jgi:hypothetical protein
LKDFVIVYLLDFVVPICLHLNSVGSAADCEGYTSIEEECLVESDGGDQLQCSRGFYTLYNRTVILRPKQVPSLGYY